jgi:hypothetical protein
MIRYVALLTSAICIALVSSSPVLAQARHTEQQYGAKDEHHWSMGGKEPVGYKPPPKPVPGEEPMEATSWFGETRMVPKQQVLPDYIPEGEGPGGQFGGTQAGQFDSSWKPPRFWNQQNHQSQENQPPQDTQARGQHGSPELSEDGEEIPEGRFNQGFAFGRKSRGGVSLTKGTNAEIDMSMFGSGYKTHFKFNKESDYRKIEKQSGMPSTFNEQGGVDDPLNGF